MASLDDLGRALRDDAAVNAPRASAIDVDAVTRAARARRRPRLWAVGTLSIVAALGLGGLAVAAVTPPSMIAATESADREAGTEAGTAESGASPLSDDGAGRSVALDLADLVACGAETGAGAAGNTDLALELRVPLSAASTVETIDATATLVNTGAAPLTITTGTTAVGVVKQDGIVVGRESPRDTAAVRFELAPGQATVLPMPISTLDCRGGAPLPPGDYDVWAALVILDAPPGAELLVIATAADLRLE